MNAVTSIMGILMLLFQFSIIECKRYRLDYSYKEEVDGWLKFHRVPTTWNEARIRCHAEGAVLASPLNEPFLQVMKNMIATNNSTHCGIFTGIHSMIYKGVYTSLEGVPLSKIPVRWARDEPDNHENGENCLMLLPDGTMTDVNCSDIFPYICYKKNFEHAVLTGCGTYDDKYYLESKTGNCYKFHNTCQSWRRAYMTCVAEGGHLAIINSIEEADLLQKLYAKYAAAEIPCKYNHLVLLGFWDWNEDETWLTINGDTLEEAGFMKWANGSPDNKVSSKDQHCGAIYRNGSMTKMWCSVPAPFICEKAPDSLIASEYLLYK